MPYNTGSVGGELGMAQLRVVQRLLAVTLSFLIGVGPAFASRAGKQETRQRADVPVGQVRYEGPYRYITLKDGAVEVWRDKRLIAIEKLDGTIISYAYDEKG